MALRQKLGAIFADRLRDVVLFGSYARGEATEDSDVDVLVLVDGLTQLEMGAVATVATEHGLVHGVTIAPLPFSTQAFRALSAAGRGLATEIERDGARP